MKKALFAVLLLLLLSSFAHAAETDSTLSKEISQQSLDLVKRFSASSSSYQQTITAQELADSINASRIAEQVEARNVCLSLGEFSSNPNWHTDLDGTKMTYTGDSDQDVGFFVLCEKANKLRQAAQFFPKSKIDEKFISHCPQLTIENENLACAVVLTKSVSKVPGGFEAGNIIFFVFSLLVVFPLLFLFRAENMHLRVFMLLKLVFLVAVFIIFFFLGILVPAVVNVILLFFFFVQANLSIASVILGLDERESSLQKLLLRLILGLEAIGLFIALLLLAPVI